MKKRDLLTLALPFAAPVSLVLVGAILAIAPDVLTFLISRFLGWAIVLMGVGYVFGAMLGRKNTVSRILWAMLAFALGSYLIRNPFSLARQAGMFLALMLAVKGSQMLRQSKGHNSPLGIAMIVVAVLLVLFPLSASRLVFSLCGVALIIVGIILGIDRWKHRCYLEGGSDSNIIDAL